MAYTPAQRKVIRAIRREAIRRYQSGGFTKAERHKIRSAFLTGRTEANFENPNYGDASSIGWRQETASSYPNVNRRDVPASVRRYFNEADRVNALQAPSRISQAVQRSAYPGRYGEHRGEAIRLTKRTVSGKAVAGQPPTKGKLVRGRKVVVPGVDRSAERKALLLDYLEHRNEPGSVLDLAAGLPATRSTKERSIATKRYEDGKSGKPGTTAGKMGRAEGEAVGTVKTLIERASHMNARHMPYVWGGGHGNPKAVGPWDCSGAISRLFRINPKVSGQFASWGKPGKGKHVTVYANSGHVFAEIDGRFFGTSRSNPGGGAGWIPASQMSASYLAQFTKRHPNGL